MESKVRERFNRSALGTDGQGKDIPVIFFVFICSQVAPAAPFSLFLSLTIFLLCSNTETRWGCVHISWLHWSSSFARPLGLVKEKGRYNMLTVWFITPTLFWKGTLIWRLGLNHFDKKGQKKYKYFSFSNDAWW